MRDNLFLFNYLLDEFLREIKKKFGISTKLLTVELGISKNMLNNWKKGTYSPNIKSIKKLLTYLNKFNKEQNEIIVKDPNISSLIEALLNMLYTEVIQNVPVVSQTGKVIGFVQSKNRYKYGAVVSPQIVPYNSENNFEKTNQNSERQLPSTGQFDSVFSMIGALLIGTFGFGLITKRKEN